MTVHGTPTPPPAKVAVWALQVARHTDWAATWTLWITLSALVIAVIAIVVAFKALFVAMRDAENNALQLKVALARPRFEATMTVQGSVATSGAAPLQPQGTVRYKATHFVVKVQNVGERAAKDCMLSVLIPLDQTIYMRSKGDDDTYRVVNGVTYLLRNQYSKDFMQYPFGNSFQVGLDERFKEHLISVTILWRVYDEYGQSPSEDFGRVTLNI